MTCRPASRRSQAASTAPVVSSLLGTRSRLPRRHRSRVNLYGRTIMVLMFCWGDYRARAPPRVTFPKSPENILFFCNPSGAVAVTNANPPCLSNHPAASSLRLWLLQFFQTFPFSRKLLRRYRSLRTAKKLDASSMCDGVRKQLTTAIKPCAAKITKELPHSLKAPAI